MSGQLIIKPRPEDRAAFIAAYKAHRQGGLSGTDARAAMLREWVPTVSRATAFRWLDHAEAAYTADRSAAPGQAAAPPRRRRPRPRRPRPASASQEDQDEAPMDGANVRLAHLPLTRMLTEIIQTFHGTMKYAVGEEPEKPRNPMLALRAGGGLMQAIQAALDVHARFHDATRMEAFTTAIMAELEEADTALAQRVMARLDALAQSA